MRRSGDDQLARRIVFMQAGPRDFGPGLPRDAAPPLFALILALGRVIAPVSRHRAK
jgi:hypothetical protein